MIFGKVVMTTTPAKITTAIKLKEELSVEAAVKELKFAVEVYNTAIFRKDSNGRQAIIEAYSAVKLAKVRLFLAETERTRAILDYSDDYLFYLIDEEGRVYLNPDYQLPKQFSNN